MKILELLSRHGVRFVLSIAIIFFMLLNVSDALPLAALSGLENLTYDVRLNMPMPNKVDERIVIIDIDEKILKKQGC